MIALAQHPYTQALAWALVHFLWQGAAIGLAAFVLRRFGRLSAATGYATGVVALAAMLAAPAITFVRIASAAPPTNPARAAEFSVPANAPSGVFAPAAITSAIPDPAPAARGFAASASAAILGVWCAGVTLLSLRLFGGWVVARRLARRAVRPVAPEIDALARRVAGRLCLDRLVGVFESSVVTVPVMIGWMKPVVLLPAAALAGLSVSQVEAVLAHELAHVRRHDYLVNLLQSVVETLLFYHPAVWWVSRRVRADREHCCDDITLGVCDRVVYATALTRLAAMTAPPRVALAATDGSLINRVRRILGQSVEGEVGSGWIPVFVVVLIVGSILPAALTSARAAESSVSPAPLSAPASPAQAVAQPAAPAVASNAAIDMPAATEPQQAAAAETERRAQEADQRARALQKQMVALEAERRALEFRKADTEGRARIAMLTSELSSLQKQYEQVKRKVEIGVMGSTDASDLESQIASVQQRLKVEQAQQEYLVSDLELKRREAELKAAAEDQDAERIALKMKLEDIERQQVAERQLRNQAADDAVAIEKLQRARELYRKGLITQSTLAEAEARVEVQPEGPLSDQARSLRERILTSPMADDALLAVLKDAGKLSNDSERALVLITVAQRQSLTPEMVSLYASAAKGIRSDEQRARVFAQAVRLRQK